MLVWIQSRWPGPDGCFTGPDLTRLPGTHHNGGRFGQSISVVTGPNNSVRRIAHIARTAIMLDTCSSV